MSKLPFNPVDRLFIRCFQCNEHVDKIEIVENWRSDSIIFAAFCHGEVDTCEIDRQDLMDFQVVKGVAFQNKKIENVKGIENEGKTAELQRAIANK